MREYFKYLTLIIIMLNVCTDITVYKYIKLLEMKCVSIRFERNALFCTGMIRFKFTNTRHVGTYR